MKSITLINLNFTIMYANPMQSGIFVFQYDYDNDGMHELVLATADGIVVFAKNDGSFLEGETLKVGQIISLIVELLHIKGALVEPLSLALTGIIINLK